MTTVARYATLALRVSLAWWAVLTGLASLISSTLAGLGALLVFPPVACIIGCAAVLVQRRGLANMPNGTSPLRTNQQLTVSLPIETSGALRTTAGVLEGQFGKCDMHITDSSVTARITQRGVLTSYTQLWRSDLVQVDASDDGAANCLLQITCKPVHAWIYRSLWVDGGRCVRRIQTLQQRILAKVRARREVEAAHAREELIRTHLAEAELMLLRAQIEPHFFV